MTAIHTQGPWSYLHPVGSDDFIVYAFDSNYTRSMVNVAWVPNKVYTHKHGWPEHNERHANARLIAAAPELLKALKHAVEIAENKRHGSWDDLLQYRAAIYKATGKA